MQFTLRLPCKNCPFRTDCLRSWLGSERAEEIAIGITEGQQTFSCHETTEFVDDAEGGCSPVLSKHEQHCAGALILLEKISRPNQLMRIAERLGHYDRSKLEMASPVFESPAEFVAHHSEK